MSRDISRMVPRMVDLFYLFKDECDRQGLKFVVTCTTRTQEEQDKLYAQGRIFPGQIVTWTLKSKHVEGKAFDIAVIKNGKVSWLASDYIPYGAIGEKVGLQWGITVKGKRKDLPHFQLREG